MTNQYYNNKFGRAVPYAIGGTVMGEETYVETPRGGYIGPTSYLGRDIGEAASNLFCIAKANEETDE